MRHPTGFFSLPREVRDLIYDGILPPDREIILPRRRRPYEETVTATSLAHPLLNVELQTRVRKHCGVRIVLKPDRHNCDIPLELDWDTFQWIKIEIDYCSDPDHPTPWLGIRPLVSALEKFEKLPAVIIVFREGGLGDSNWSEAWLNANDRDDEWAPPFLRTSGPNRLPLIEVILNYFLALPPCENATVIPLRTPYSALCCKEAHYPPYGYPYDSEYMRDICKALERWLGGLRDLRIDGWKGGTQKTRLHRLAYTRYEGRAYCKRR